MIAIFVYFIVELAQSPDPITYKDRPYPNVVYSKYKPKPISLNAIIIKYACDFCNVVIGWILFAFGVLQIPGWAIYAVYKQKGSSLLEVSGG